MTVLLAAAILAAPLPLGRQVTFQAGEVARRDVVAQRQATYPSDVLTEQRRAAAANGVLDVYDPPQARAGREQLAVLSQLLQTLGRARNSDPADDTARRSALATVEAIPLPTNLAERALALPEEAWERVTEEAQVVLERAMREEIRETNLSDERRRVPARVRLDLPEEDAAIVTALVQDRLVPNSFYNADRTAERRQEARASVEPVLVTVAQDETILRAGDIVTELDVEALRALGLQHSESTWAGVQAAGAFALLLGLVLLYYFWRQEPDFWSGRTDPDAGLRGPLWLALCLLGFLLAARLTIPGRTVVPYLFPYAALTMLLALTTSLRIALVLSGFFALTVGWLTGGSLELMVYALCGGIVGATKLRRSDRLVNFVWAALYVAVSNLLVLIAFDVVGGGLDGRGLLELGVAAISNGLLSLTVTIAGLYVASALFGLTTSLQLIEISRPTHPLQRQLLLRAPGTYHHTLIVSNMAERAAEAVGADALLTRVGAYYHDVGKSVRPYFFIENRSEGPDPHERLDPLSSAQLIIAHVKDGIELGRKYRLPRRVIDFIPEHHGDLAVVYFLHKAAELAAADETVNRAQFQYPGPRPRSRETAITMLADGAEATVRSKRPDSVEELERIVAESIQSRVASGQLDGSGLTTADLAVVRKVFVDTLRGLQHPRIDYPPEPALHKSAAGAATQVGK
jgi:hypothetical protein